MVVFLVIGGIGLALLLATLLLGDIIDGVFDGVGGEWFSGAGLAGFVGAFGFVGALVVSATDNPGLGIVGGLVAGVLIGLGAAWVTSRLRDENDGSTVRSGSLVGHRGTVSTDIPEVGHGVVSLVVHGHITRLNARADRPLPAGTPIRIVDVTSATSVRVTQDLGADAPR